MCINNDEHALLKEKSKKTPLILWKVVRVSDFIGAWHTTYSNKKFVVGKNVAESFLLCGKVKPGQFHCFFTRDNARNYRKYDMHQIHKFKIIKVYANREDIVAVGFDENCHRRSLSVSKMEIKSLKHQR